MPVISYIYSIPYLVIFFILLFLALNEVGKLHVIGKESSRRAAFLLMLFFIGLRGHLSTDFIGYYTFYKALPSIGSLSAAYLDRSHFEPGFVIYSSLIKTFSQDYYVWVFINALLDFLVLYHLGKKYCVSVAFLFILFIPYSGLIMEVNLYRNAKAVMLFLLSLPYLQKRSLFPYMALNLLGCTFHMSSITYIPLYFILCREIPKVWVWGMFVLANMVFFLGISLSSYLENVTRLVDGLLGSDSLTDKAIGWQKNEIYGAAKGFTVGYFERLSFFVLFTLKYKDLVREKAMNLLFYNAFLVYYFLFHILSPISNEIMGRMTILFAFSYWFLVPNLVCRPDAKRVLFFAVILLCLMKIAVGNKNLSMRYHNIILSGEDNYNERRVTAFRVMRAMQQE